MSEKNPGCSHCRGGAYIDFDRAYTVELDGRKLSVGVTVQLLSGRYTEWFEVPVNYCPMCGRRLFG